MREGIGTAESADAAGKSLHRKMMPGLVGAGLFGSDSQSISAAQPGAEFDDAEIEGFALMLLDGAEERAAASFAEYLASGVAASVLFEQLLTGSARMLGQMWERDRCSFADVTLGLAVIHNLLYRHGHRLEDEISPVHGDHAILITPLPGENHIFAAALLAEYFRAAKWRVYSGVNGSREEITALVAERDLDAIAVTVSDQSRIEECKQLVAELRSASLSPSVRVMAGGPPFSERPGLFRRVGADATARDAKAALGAVCEVCSIESQQRR